MLPIGRHIEGEKWPAWLSGNVNGPALWDFVASAMVHRMNGTQLVTLYDGLETQLSGNASPRPAGAVNHATPGRVASQCPYYAVMFHPSRRQPNHKAVHDVCP
jgi:hypothetical protein